MKLAKKILAVMLSLSLAVVPVSGTSAKKAETNSSVDMQSVQEMIESEVQEVVSKLDTKANAYAATEVPVTTEVPTTETPATTVAPTTEVPATTETPVTTVPKVTYYDVDGKSVKVLTPYVYTKTSQLTNPKYNMYEIKASLGYEKDVKIPVKVKGKGALIYALAAGYTDVDLGYYSLYSDSACKNRISTSDNVAYVPKAGTYYIKVSNYYLSEVQDSIIIGAFAFISGENKVLENKASLVSAIVSSKTPIYYKVRVKTTTKLTFTVTADYSATVTLCNSKKKAITNDTYLYSSDTEQGAKSVYVVGKGSYYFRVKSSQGILATKAIFTSVKSSSGTSKSKAGVLRVNGATKSILIYPSDTTKKNYYLKFYNPKKQKVFVNMISSFSSGKMQFQFYDSKGDCFGTRYIYDGINEKNSYQTYVSSYSSSTKTLPKGTYYIKLKKLDNKTSGIIQVKVSTKSN